MKHTCKRILAALCATLLLVTTLAACSSMEDKLEGTWYVPGEEGSMVLKEDGVAVVAGQSVNWSVEDDEWLVLSYLGEELRFEIVDVDDDSMVLSLDGETEIFHKQ